MKIAPLIVMSLFLTGCVSAGIDRDIFTEDQAHASQPYAFDNVRLSPQDTGLSVRLEKDVRERLKEHPQVDVSILTLSGGGADGAFGAGVLTSWTKKGDRPEFTIVTGVSTGALIAPFAFLGPSYDPQLKEAYTSGIASKLLKRRSPLDTLFSPGVFKSDGLQGVVDHFVDVPLIEAIAIENDKGRRLNVATTNLDTQSGVIWDIGAIAAQGVARGPAGEIRARDLIRKVLVASASVPGAFAPVMIPAEFDADGVKHQFSEMHVDGGVSMPFFILPESMLNWKVPSDIAVHGHVYVLINGNIDPHFLVTPYKTFAVAGRSLDTLTRAQARSTLQGIQGFACRNGFVVSVASIPDNFKGGGLLAFDKTSMQRVFNSGSALETDGKAFKALDGCDAK